MDKPHPEASDDEVCIGNIWSCDFAAIGWQTKRLGKIPLSAEGERLRGGSMRPVLVSRAEIEAAGVVIPDDGRRVDHRWMPLALVYRDTPGDPL